MSEIETVVMNESGVKAYVGEHPPSVGLKAGAFADVGTLILTNRRFVYINKGGAARAASFALGGALIGWAAEKSVSKAELDDFMKYKGSYCISIDDITHVEDGRHVGSAFLRVDNKNPNLKPSYSYIFGAGFTKPDQWVTAINSVTSSSRRSSPLPSPTFNNFPINPTNNPYPQTIQSETKQTCPSCGATTNPQAKFCMSCGIAIPLPKPSPSIKAPAKFCGQCGAQLGSNDQFCRSCGTKIYG